MCLERKVALTLPVRERGEGASRAAVSIDRINPAEGGPAFHGMQVFEAWGLGRVANVTDLSTTTVAALIPAEWSVSICDERLDRVDFGHPAPLVGLTGKVFSVFANG